MTGTVIILPVVRVERYPADLVDLVGVELDPRWVAFREGREQPAAQVIPFPDRRLVSFGGAA